MCVIASGSIIIFGNNHDDSGYVYASNIEYVDLLRIIARCRGVKKITLVNMVVSNEVLNAIALTRVETLIISDCALRTSYMEKRYSSGEVVLPFGNKDIAQGLDDTTSTLQFFWSRRSFLQNKQRKEDEQNFKEILSNQHNDPETKITTRFQFLKYILLINANGVLCVNESFDVKLKKLKDFNPSETDLTTLNFNVDEYCLECSNNYFSEKSEECYTSILTVKNHSPIHITALHLDDKNTPFRYTQHLTIEPERTTYSIDWYNLRKSLPIYSLSSFSDWIAILKKYELFHCFDSNTLVNVSEKRLLECMEAKLISPFATCDGKSYLETRYLKPMFDTIPMLSNASKKGKKYEDWRNSDIVKSCVKLITWIHANRSDAVHEENPAAKKALKFCKDIDKKWKTWFEGVTFDTEPEDMIYWAHFLLTGEFSPNSNKKKKKPQIEQESDEEEKPKKRTSNRKKKKDSEDEEKPNKKKTVSKRKKKDPEEEDDDFIEKESKKKKKESSVPPSTERRVTRSSSMLSSFIK